MQNSSFEQLNNALNVHLITERWAKSQKYGRKTGVFPQMPVQTSEPVFRRASSIHCLGYLILHIDSARTMELILYHCVPCIRIKIHFIKIFMLDTMVWFSCSWDLHPVIVCMHP